VVTALAVGGVLLAVMIAASGYAAVTLPADTRIRLHLGSHEHFLLVSKRAGLIIWPAAGAAAYGVLGGVSASGLAAGWVPGVRDVLLPAVMCVMLGFQAGSLVLARQHQDPGDATEPGAGTGGEGETTGRSEDQSPLAPRDSPRS
jgi:hypothetical protein